MSKMVNSMQLRQRQSIIIAPPISTNKEDMMSNAVNKTPNELMSEEALHLIAEIIENENSNGRLSDLQILEKLISNDAQYNNFTKQDIAFARKKLNIKTSESR